MYYNCGVDGKVFMGKRKFSFIINFKYSKKRTVYYRDKKTRLISLVSPAAIHLLKAICVVTFLVFVIIRVDIFFSFF